MKYSQRAFTILIITVAVFCTATIFAAQQDMAASSKHNNSANKRGYVLELARLDKTINAFQRLSSEKPRSWLHQERLAEALLDRARLTGHVPDYIAAQAAIQSAFVISGKQSGPFLTRAALNFSMHRLLEVEEDLAKAESALLLDGTSTSIIAGLRADVFHSSGQYAKAKALYDATESASPSSSTAIRLAFYFVSLADFEQAENWFLKAESRVVGRAPLLRSWLKLQLGILDLERGRWKQAYHHYDAARTLFPGHWLIEEHIAEVEALLGYSKKAEKKYRDLVERTNSPVLTSALADLLHSNNSVQDDQAAVEWAQRASNQFNATRAVAPELIAGHALDFYLQSNDHKLALTLALENYQLRPAGKAAIPLVQAYAINGEHVAALALLEQVLDSPYRSAELYATASVVFEVLGRNQYATEYEALAAKLNPASINEVQWFKVKLNHHN